MKKKQERTKRKSHILSAENLEAMENLVQLNEKGEPFAWGRDTKMKMVICPHYRKRLEFVSILPKMMCYKCGKIIDNILKYE